MCGYGHTKWTHSKRCHSLVKHEVGRVTAHNCNFSSKVLHYAQWGGPSFKCMYLFHLSLVVHVRSLKHTRRIVRKWYSIIIVVVVVVCGRKYAGCSGRDGWRLELWFQRIWWLVWHGRWLEVWYSERWWLCTVDVRVKVNCKCTREVYCCWLLLLLRG